MKKNERTVLVGVLKEPRDLRILLTQHWYRIPLAHLPKEKFQYLAFYQPAAFGKRGKRIEYYARAGKITTRKRRELLPRESAHPRAEQMYARVEVSEIVKLSPAIMNSHPRRISFGFTTLKNLLAARTILELYEVAPTEEIVFDFLRQAGIPATKQCHVSYSNVLKNIGIRNKRRYVLDFAIFCNHGKIAVECDNTKAHGGKAMRLKDKQKDADLRAQGWSVIRLKEKEIIKRPKACLKKIERQIRKLGGVPSLHLPIFRHVVEYNL